MGETLGINILKSKSINYKLMKKKVTHKINNNFFSIGVLENILVELGSILTFLLIQR